MSAPPLGAFHIERVSARGCAGHGRGSGWHCRAVSVVAGWGTLGFRPVIVVHGLPNPRADRGGAVAVPRMWADDVGDTAS